MRNAERERGAKCIVQMKGTQTVLIPPPGADKAGGGKNTKDLGGPKVFNFDHSYWSFSRNDGQSYGACARGRTGSWQGRDGRKGESWKERGEKRRADMQTDIQLSRSISTRIWENRC